MDTELCPLCKQSTGALVAECGKRPLCRCRTCDLTFVPARYHVSPEQELQRYALHTNSEDDAGYVAFLESVASAVERFPLAHPDILDFGSGPNQVLTTILHRRGYACRAYDPLYGVGLDALESRYDIVVLCEVFEHLRDPQGEFERIIGLLKPRGLVLMHTLLRPFETGALSSWWYARDITHVNFLSMRCCEYIAVTFGMQIVECNGRSLVCYGPRPARCKTARAACA
jgi:SAM-dependent methyltransferase